MKKKLEAEHGSSNINKEMLEIKKKIQLSEGQRKAAFEDLEAEKKHNVEEIHKLKKEITQLVKDVNETTHTNASLRTYRKRIEKIIGPLENKNNTEVCHLLDLQIVDKTKAVNLLDYKIKKRETHLACLASEYQILLSQKTAKEVRKKVDKPNQKAVSELQNNIHAVEVQLREGIHISERYQNIKKSLKKDSAKFESNIKKIEEELIEQENDIRKLQQVMDEATQKRSITRNRLVLEEKNVMMKAHTRERQTMEGRRLVNNRRQELEMLEKNIFQAQKIAQNEAVQEDHHQIEEDDTGEALVPEPPLDEVLAQNFEILKQATGATTPGEVLDKFLAQKQTFEKLVVLRKEAEEEKDALEKKLEDLNSQLEFYKYTAAKETEKKSSRMEEVQTKIEEEKTTSLNALAVKATKEKMLSKIFATGKLLHRTINPRALSKETPFLVLNDVKNELLELLERHKEEFGNLAEGDEGTMEEKWLPSPYSGLVRRTPIPQPGASPAPPPPVSDEEDEVPSRSFLKRQAQLVVDAKTRRKNIRMQPPKRT